MFASYTINLEDCQKAQGIVNSLLARPSGGKTGEFRISPTFKEIATDPSLTTFSVEFDKGSVFTCPKPTAPPLSQP